MIAVSHPGKIGDALYCLPSIRELSKKYNCKVDFYTSKHCLPIQHFMELQDCINECIIPESYTIERYDMGIQPWSMPIESSGYETIYQMGFKNIPDKSLPEYLAESIGLDRNIGNNIYYNFIDEFNHTDNNYIVIAPRGETGYAELFRGVIDYYKEKNIECFIVGGQGDYINKGNDYTHLTFNQMTSLISHSKFYLGIMSAPLVIANGFNVPKIIPYTNTWDMRHVVIKPESHYMFEPTLEQILQIMGNYI